ncbi:MAG: flagella basal body P-ring formation protein FlgA [Gammaproteobacteria bacterium]|nr:flagella basal body P-ring formation protein FlgA [Gammaproteobacteria bacterium]
MFALPLKAQGLQGYLLEQIDRWHQFCCCPGNRTISKAIRVQQTFDRRIGFMSIFALSKRYAAIGLLFCSGMAYAQGSIAADSDAKEILFNQLLDWLPADIADPAMLQGINDQRFKVPLCAGSFDFSFNDHSQRIIKAQCSSNNWQRLVRLKPSKSKPLPGNSYIYAYALQSSVLAEQSISRDNLKRIKKPRQHMARNALTTLPAEALFASRTLRKGQILTTADIYHAQTVAIAITTIPAGYLISEDHLKLQKVDYKVPNDAISDLSGLQHLAANRLIHPGSVLRQRDVKNAKLVRRGEEVILSAGSDRYSIETTATALQDGYLGDQVKLKNINSNQIVRAVVSGSSRTRALRY